MSGVLLTHDQHFLACFPGKNAPFASKRVKNPILACGCRKSAKFSVRFSSFTANNVKSVGTLSLDRIVSGKVNALAKEGSDDGGGVSVVENDSQPQPSFFDEYVKAMESVISYRERKGSDDEDRNSSKRVLSEGVGEDDSSLSRDDAQSENGGDDLPRNGAIRKGKFERKETRAYEKEKVASKGGTDRKEEQNFGRSLNGLDVDKDASIKVLVHEARKDNHKVGWGDKLAQNSVWKGKDKPENKENRVDREAKWVSKDESIRKERQVLRKDFSGHDAVVDFQQTFAAKDEPFRKEKQISGKDFNGRDAVMDRQRTSAAKDESVRKERHVLGKDFSGRDAVLDHQRRSSAKDESFRKERLVLGKDFYGRDTVVDHQRTSAPNNESVRKERHVLGKDFKGRDAVVDHQQRSAAKDESFRKERQVLGKDFNGRDAVVDRQRTSATNNESVRKERQVLGKDFYGCNAVVVHQQTSVANVHGSKERSSGEGKPYAGRRSSGQDRHVDSQRVATYRYGNEKSNVKLLGSGVREGKVSVNGYASEQGFRNKKKAWQSEDDDAGFKMDRAAFRTSEVPGEIVDKPKTSRMEMEERIQKLANRLNGADIEIPEWMFSQMMRSAKIKFCDHSIMRVIQILGKLGNWRRVLQVIEWLQERERHKSHRLRYIYTAALDALGKARRPVEALNLFQTMQNKMSSYPDLVAYHSIAVTLGQAGHMRELFDVIDIMRSPPKKIKTSKLLKWDPILEPDLVVYDAVLNACVKRKQWEGTFWVLQQLKQSGQEPSSTTYGLIMEVMFTCEKYNLVHELFRKVQKSGIPSALIYKVLVNTLWREGKTDEAVLAVQEMERRGIVGPAALYYDLARCLCSAGRCQEALMLMEKICKVANKPLVVTYTGLIQTCLDSGEIQNATFIFKEMEKFCSPNLVTCNIMINAYIKHRMYEEAKDLFNKMLEDRDHIISKADYKTCVLPDTYTFNTMLDACFEGKMWDDLEFIFQKMLDHGYHFNAGRHLRFVLESSRAGKTGPLEATWNYFACGDQIPPPALLKEHFCTKLVERDYATALSSFFRSPGSNGPGFSKQAWSKLLKENIRRFCRDGIEGLVNEVEFRVLPSSSEPNPELETLLISCKEVLGIGIGS